MQQAVFEYYPNAQAVYRFKHRDMNRLFPKVCIEKFKASLNSSLSLTNCVLTSRDVFMQVSPRYGYSKMNVTGCRTNAATSSQGT